MNAPISRYPLQWPSGWRRTPAADRTYGHFGTRRASVPGGYAMLRDITLADATNRVLQELIRMGIPDADVAISTNVALRLDGLPRSDQRAPSDPGAAVYWTDGGHARCIAIDRYNKVEDNLAAIAATVEAMRAIERHGGATILDRAFVGFEALPAPGQSSRTWRDVLGFHPATHVSANDVTQAYRRLAGERHPDRGGSDAAMAELNAARDEALRNVP